MYRYKDHMDSNCGYKKVPPGMYSPRLCLVDLIRKGPYLRNVPNFLKNTNTYTKKNVDTSTCIVQQQTFRIEPYKAPASFSCTKPRFKCNLQNSQALGPALATSTLCKIT